MGKKSPHIIDELKSIAPGLHSLLDKEEELPDGYFEHLEDRILQETIGQRPAKNRIRRLWRNGVFMAAAAIVLLFVGMRIWSVDKIGPGFEEQMATLEYEELLELLEEVDLEADWILDTDLIDASIMIQEYSATSEQINQESEVEENLAGKYVLEESDYLENISEEDWLDLYEDGLGF